MAKTNHKARADIKKNRLYITVAEKVTKKSIDKLYTDIRFCVADLQPGFEVINDLSSCTLAAISGFPTYRKITNHLLISQVGRVVRVIDPSKIIKRQMFNMEARIQGYKVEILDSIEDAEKYLDSFTEKASPSISLLNTMVDYSFEDKQWSGQAEYLSVDTISIKSAVEVPEEGTQISLTLTFEKHEDLLEEFSATAEVKSIEGSVFEAAFTDLDEALKERLWARLVHESRCEITE